MKRWLDAGKAALERVTGIAFDGYVCPLCVHGYRDRKDRLAVWRNDYGSAPGTTKPKRLRACTASTSTSRL